MSNQKTQSYITILNASKTAGKTYALDSKGEVEKFSGNSAEYSATVVQVDNAKQLKKILRKVSKDSNLCILFGYFEGIEVDEEFTIYSAKRIEELGGTTKGWHTIEGRKCITRQKHNLKPSSWFYFDCDTYSDTPRKFKFKSYMKWWAKMTERAPELEGAEVLFGLSSSSRVLLPNGKPYKPENYHAFLRVKNPEDIERYRIALFIHFTNSKEYTYSHKIKGGLKVPRTIFDSSTLATGRLCFDGKPDVKGKLSVKKPKYEVFNGGTVNTKDLVTPKESKYGYISSHHKSTCLVSDSLTLDMEVTTQSDGVITIEEYIESKHTKLRCQSPFRPESESMAAILNRHSNTRPFLYDVGSGIKYELKRDKSTYDEECLINRVEKPLEFLWDFRISKKTVTTVVGPAGTGKSTLMAWIVATVSSGGTWGDGTEVKDQGSVLWLNGEDPVDEVVIPRLKAANADMSKITVMCPRIREGAISRGFTFLKDVEEIRLRLKARDDYKLIIVDPISAFLDGADSHNQAEVRSILATITDICEEFDVSAIIVAHPKKDWKGALVDAINGSSAFHSASRLIVGVVPDPDNKNKILFGNIKNNHQKDDAAKTLIYRLKEVKRPDLSNISSYGLASWEGESKIEVRDLRGHQYNENKKKVKNKDLFSLQVTGILNEEGPMMKNDLESILMKNHKLTDRQVKENLKKIKEEGVVEWKKIGKFYQIKLSKQKWPEKGKSEVKVDLNNLQG